MINYYFFKRKIKFREIKIKQDDYYSQTLHFFQADTQMCFIFAYYSDLDRFDWEKFNNDQIGLIVG